LIATASLIWLSLSFLPWGAGARLAIGAAYLAFAPGVSLAMRTGNVSPVAGALVVAGLMAWPRATLVSGLALGGSLAWKPLGVLAIPMLALHRPVAPGRRHWIAAAVAAALALLWILLGATYLGDFLRMGASLDPRDIAVSRTVSLHRFLWSLGLPIDRLAVSIAVAVVALAAARRRRWSSTRTLCYAIAACCLTLPSLWPHTLLMTLPIQVLALRRAVERFTRRPRATGSDAGVVGALARERRGRTYELLLVMTGIAALQWSEGVGGVPTEPSLMLALAIAPPLFAPSLLALYALADEPRTDC
jgi:hypothetical protein